MSVNTVATVFASIINPADVTAEQCSIELATPLAVDFTYRQADPLTNQVIGETNPTLDILPAQTMAFVLALTPRQTFDLTELTFNYVCANTGSAPITAGLNTLQLASSAEPVADMVAVALTPSADGIADVGLDDFGFYVVATSNVGAEATITVSPSTGPWFTGDALICETDAASGACVAPPAPTAQTTMGAQSTQSFAVFVRSDSPIELNPTDRRQSVRFFDEQGALRGSTSVALTTDR